MSHNSEIVELTRRLQFSACHRLNSDYLTPEENLKVYGKCNNPNGHGHNYEVQVTVRGPVDKRTGMVLNIYDLNLAMKKAIMDEIDHKNLDKDIDYFQNIPSTTENLAIFIWTRMKLYLPCPHLLYEVRIKETENNFVCYRGE